MGECSECHQNKDCRPYGEDGKDICFQCAMVNEDRTAEQFANVMPVGNALLTSQGPIPYIGPIPTAYCFGGVLVPDTDPSV